MPELQTYKGAYLWHYVPSFPAAITFATLFALATLAHTYKMLRTKQYFCIPFFLGGLCMSSIPTQHRSTKTSIR
jgi:hypothetical protein